MLFCQQIKVQSILSETDEALARIYYNQTHFRVSTKPGFDAKLKASETFAKQAKSAMAKGNGDEAMSLAVEASQNAIDCLDMFTL